ncbi:MAG TPA: hypothetical protein VK002_00250 [Rubricoccaceae bacterium]|nr:hypothetical protein [Rubricoccaceae bacterium]
MLTALRRLNRVLPFRWALRVFLFLTPQGRALRRGSWLLAPAALWLTRKR